MPKKKNRFFEANGFRFANALLDTFKKYYKEPEGKGKTGEFVDRQAKAIIDAVKKTIKEKKLKLTTEEMYTFLIRATEYLGTRYETELGDKLNNTIKQKDREITGLKNENKELSDKIKKLKKDLENQKTIIKKLEGQKDQIAKISYELAVKNILKTSAIVVGILVVGFLILKVLVKRLFKIDINFSDLLFLKNMFEKLKTNNIAMIFVTLGLILIVTIAAYVAKKRMKINDGVIKAAIEGAEKAQAESKK